MKLARAIDFIKGLEPYMDFSSDDLDFDAMSNETLWQLQQFLVSEPNNHSLTSQIIVKPNDTKTVATANIDIDALADMFKKKMKIGIPLKTDAIRMNELNPSSEFSSLDWMQKSDTIKVKLGQETIFIAAEVFNDMIHNAKFNEVFGNYGRFQAAELTLQSSNLAEQNQSIELVDTDMGDTEASSIIHMFERDWLNSNNNDDILDRTDATVRKYFSNQNNYFINLY